MGQTLKYERLNLGTTGVRNPFTRVPGANRSPGALRGLRCLMQVGNFGSTKGLSRPYFRGQHSAHAFCR